MTEGYYYIPKDLPKMNEELTDEQKLEKMNKYRNNSIISWVIISIVIGLVWGLAKNDIFSGIFIISMAVACVIWMPIYWIYSFYMQKIIFGEIRLQRFFDMLTEMN